jgi:tripeptide aminopeptidase
MDPADFEYLNRVIGQDIIVTDGNSLLGADDKAGVAEIMEFVEFIAKNPKYEHGDIYICFTPDEEIGAGTDKINLELFKPSFAYTLDGSETGGIEYETFNAASCLISITGKSIHPGDAKNKMVNAAMVANEFINMLPAHLNPATTEGYEGFNHLVNQVGSCESASLYYIIRNHDRAIFENQKKQFAQIADYLNNKYGYQLVNIEIKDSYYNMKEKIEQHLEIVEIVREAAKKCGIQTYTFPVRGGTDGARLTDMGILTPNIGTGGYYFHGKYEYVSINQMEKTVELLKELTKLIISKEINI